MFATGEEAAAHLADYLIDGFSSVVAIPEKDGGTYIAAVRPGLTVEVWYDGERFIRSLVTGTDRRPQEPATERDLLACVNVPVPLKAALLDPEFSWGSVPGPGEIQRDRSGRILGDPVRVGDVWACNSFREWGRTFRITEVDDTHCYGVVLTDSEEVARGLRLAARARETGGEYDYVARTSVGAMVKIRLDRMRPTNDGYYLLPAQAPAQAGEVA